MKSTVQINGFVSCVMILSRCDDFFRGLMREVDAFFSSRFDDHEIVVICNPIEASQIEAMEELLRNVPSVRFIVLSSSVSDEVLLAAGMEQAIGDFIVLMNPHRDSIQVVPQMVELCHDGSDVVLGIGENLPRGMGYRLLLPFSRMVLHRVLGYLTPANYTGLTCLSRRAANAIMQTSRFHQTFEARVAQSGYFISTYEYRVSDLATYSKKSCLGLFRNTLRLLVLNSTRPLRWTGVIGFIGSASALTFSLYSIIVRLLKRDVVEGWASQMVVTSFLFLLAFIMLGLFGEYLARLLNDISGHAQYDVLFEKHSSVMLDTNRLNVFEDSSTEIVNQVQSGRDR